MKKMKPISFRADMVQSILDNRKWQTRRPISPQPDVGKMRYNGERWEMYQGYPEGHGVPMSKYKVGDILYVQEDWRIDSINTYDGHMIVEYRDGTIDLINDMTQDRLERYYDQTIKQLHSKKGEPYWRPARYMPKEVARIFLEVKDVRVERLHEITEHDAIAEGFEPMPCGCSNKGVYGCEDCMNSGAREPARLYFHDTWSDIYKDSPEHRWEQNPYVTVTEFERVER